MSSLEQGRRENVEVVRGAVNAFRRGDFDGIFALARDDFEIFLPPSLPNAGRYVGREGFMSWLEQWLDAWDGFTVEISEAEPVGEHHVLTDMHQSARGKGSGVAVEMDLAYLWDVRDGKLAAMHLYGSRDEALRVVDERERQGPD
jgi:ketosteroid isomerase-like protein